MSNSDSKSVSFTPELAAFVSTCVESGRYQSVSEVVWAGLRILQAREAERLAQLDRARSMVETGARDLDEGRVVDGEEVFRRIRKKHAELAEKP